METVAKDYQLPTDAVQKLHQLIRLLTNSAKFRKNLPDALSLLNRRLGASNAFLFEMAPIYFDTHHLAIQRILQIPLIGSPKEHTIPAPLASIHFPASSLEDWLNQIRAFSSESNPFKEKSSELTDENSAIFGEVEKIEEAVEYDVDLSVLYKQLGIPNSDFVLFPLLQGKNIFGLLFFLSSKKKNLWEPMAIDLATAGAALITNLLEQQYTENQKLLEKKLLPSKKTPTSGDNTDIISTTFEQPDISISENDLSSIISSIIPDFVFIIDLELGEAIYCNAETFLGYNFKETNNPLQTFINNIHPNFKAGTIKRFFEKIERIDNDETLIHEFMVRHKNGHWVWINERNKVFKRHPEGKVKQYLSFMQDVTEKKTAFLALAESEERYRNFVSYSSEGIYYTNCGEPISIHLPVEEQTELFYKNAYIEECNLVMAKMYGFQSGTEMIGHTIDHIHRGEDYELNKNSFREVISKGYKVDDVETIEITTKGEKRYFLNRAVGVIENDHLVGMWGVQQDITERRQAEIIYEKNMSRFSNISKDAKMGLWEWHLDTQSIHVNETYLDLVGFEDRIRVFDQNKVADLIHPDDLASIREISFYNIEHNIDACQVEVRFKKQEDEWRWFQVYGRLVKKAPDGTPLRLTGMLIDIHQVKTTKLRLQEGEALLKAVLDAVPDTKLHVRLDGTIITVYSSSQNKGEQIYFSQEIEGRNLLEVVPVFTAKGLLFNVGEAIKTKSLQRFEYLNEIDDNTYYFEARINQVNETEAIIILRDMTFVKKIENDLNEQIYKHDQNVRQLKKYIDSNLQLENFAYIASHDLREPLRTMRMFGQFLKKNISKQLDDENQSYLDFIISGAKRMNELIEGILTFSRVDTDPLEKEVIKTADLLADSIDNLSKAIEKKKASVVIEAIPPSIFGSRIRLEQVFQNLIANGIKFSNPNTPPRIVITGEENKTHWIFKVKDNGIGIKEEFFDQIFVLFKKLHNNQEFDGVGIGLALLKRIIEQHDGEIWLESEENIGTTFLFSLQKEKI